MPQESFGFPDEPKPAPRPMEPGIKGRGHRESTSICAYCGVTGTRELTTMHPARSDLSRKRSHAVSDPQEGALMAAYRMFPPVDPDRADELAAGDTSVGFRPNGIKLSPNVRDINMLWIFRHELRSLI